MCFVLVFFSKLGLQKGTQTKNTNNPQQFGKTDNHERTTLACSFFCGYRKSLSETWTQSGPVVHAPGSCCWSNKPKTGWHFRPCKQKEPLLPELKIYNESLHLGMPCTGCLFPLILSHLSGINLCVWWVLDVGLVSQAGYLCPRFSLGWLMRDKLSVLQQAGPGWWSRTGRRIIKHKN